MDKLISGNSNTISIYDKFEDPLYLAIDISDLDLVRLAIKKGFSLNEEALVLALEIGNIEIVDFLIKNGVNLDSDLGKKAIQFINSKFKDLFTAIRFSWLYNAKDLIESGLDINSFFCESSYNDNEEYKCTPLIFASSKGERDCRNFVGKWC